MWRISVNIQHNACSLGISPGTKICTHLSMTEVLWQVQLCGGIGVLLIPWKINKIIIGKMVRVGIPRIGSDMSDRKVLDIFRDCGPD